MTKTKSTFIFLSIFFIYLILRCFAWKNTILLEDTDSLSYISSAKVFLSFNLKEIINLDPDVYPAYSFYSALFSLTGSSVEFGARLCSFLFSLLLFIAIMGIGKQIAKPSEVAVGLFILCFSPTLISLSFSVLSEPSYIATVYLGIWLFWTQYKNPKFWKAGLLGVIFGLSFLHRTEGLLYIAIIPFLQGIHLFFEKQKYYSFKGYITWTLLFVICFSMMAIPQIWRVSHKMGCFAINGRQAWTAWLKNPEDRRNDWEKVFALDFSQKEINISYVKSHPEVWKKRSASISPMVHLKTLVHGFNSFYERALGTLIGPFGLIFFAFGLWALYKKRCRFEIFLILAFTGFNLLFPLTQPVKMRYIAIIAPLIMLTEGIGILYLSSRVVETYRNISLGKRSFTFIFLFCLIGSSASGLRASLRPPQYNREYSHVEQKKPLAILKIIRENELLRPPIITASRAFLAYFAGGKQFYVPYTNYESLVRYCDLNNVDFLYLKHELLKYYKYPFFEVFLKDTKPNDFILLYSGVDPYGGKIELYRFQKKT